MEFHRKLIELRGFSGVERHFPRLPPGRSNAREKLDLLSALELFSGAETPISGAEIHSPALELQSPALNSGAEIFLRR